MYRYGQCHVTKQINTLGILESVIEYRLTTNKYKAGDKLCDVIAKDYRLLQVMSRFGISLGFGEKTIGEVCRLCGVDTETFIKVINYVKNGAENVKQDVGEVSVAALLDYLKKTHRYYLDYLLPSIRFHLLNAIDCSVKNEVAFLVLKFFDEYVDEVRHHMDYEDNAVFSYVEKLLSGEPIDIEGGHLLSSNHASIEDKLNELKNLFLKYYPQQENNEKLNSVIISIYQAEEELCIHCRVEDNIFSPAVRMLERRNKLRGENTGKGERDSTEGLTEDQLSNREKEVVACVAKGMSNKDIADKLYLSINTVTTHRRNIARKLHIHSSAGLTIYAIVNKLVTLDEVNM